MDNNTLINRIVCLEEEVKKLKEKIKLYEISTKIDYEKIKRLKGMINSNSDDIEFLDYKFN